MKYHSLFKVNDLFLLMVLFIDCNMMLVTSNPQRSRISRQLKEKQKCPSDSNCVNYRSCVQGVISTGPSEATNFKKLSLEELVKFGTPCGNLESLGEVCCKRNDSAVIATNSVETRSIINTTCPAGLNCISYRWCANGVATNFRSGFDLIGPSLQELEEYGRPCGNAQVCCRGTPPLENESERSTTSSPSSTEAAAVSSSISTSTKGTTILARNQLPFIFLQIPKDRSSSTIINTTIKLVRG